jgi:hypothetical protein
MGDLARIDDLSRRMNIAMTAPAAGSVAAAERRTRHRFTLITLPMQRFVPPLTTCWPGEVCSVLA